MEFETPPLVLPLVFAALFLGSLFLCGVVDKWIWCVNTSIPPSHCNELSHTVAPIELLKEGEF